jgi:protocatechuate 3,4-dioxygenase beta subunit
VDPNERLAEVTTRLVAALHAAVEDLRVTEGELRAALAFLREVAEADELPLLSDVLGISVQVDRLTHGTSVDGTATNVEGPFYLPGAPSLEPPYALAADTEPGEALFVSGTVADAATGEPLPGAVLDLWQANAEGLYSNQDPERLGIWRLRGTLTAGPDGAYAFRTITPPPYEIKKDGPVGRLLAALGRHAFRPAHLHVKTSSAGHVPLTTMVYFEGDPWLESDAIDGVKDSLVVPVERHDSTEAMAGRGVDRPFATCSFDIRLRPA